MTIKINGDNTVANPGFSGNDTDTGLQVGTNELKLVTGGTARATVDSSGNVIIGTGSLASNVRLRIKAENSYKSVLQFADQDDDNVGELAYNHNDNTLAVNVNDSERLRIDSSGRVGLGGTPDAWDTDSGLQAIQLHGYGALWNYYNNVQLAFNTYQSSGGDKYLTTDEASKYTLDGAGNHIWYTAASGSADAAITFSERMRLNNSGNFGIGTSNPDKLLHVVSSGNTRTKVSTTSASSFGQMYFGDEDKYVIGYRESHSNQPRQLSFKNTHSSGSITFRAGGDQERMRIDSSGKVGINISNPGSYNGSGNELVLGNTGSNGGMTIVSGTGNNGHIFFADGTSGGALNRGIIKYEHANDAMAFNTAETERMRITSSGNVGIGKSSASSTTGGIHFVPSGTSEIIASGNNITPLIIGSSNDVTLTLVDFTAGSATPGGSISITSGTSVAYNTSSDYRLKENVVDLDGAIDRVKQLAPKRFNFIVDADKTVDGFLAHEAQTVVPEAVTGEKDGEKMQGIDQAKLVPLLTAALKEAITKIETLETKVAALEAA